MNSSIDRVWARIKETAQSLAEAGQSITFRRARVLVEQFIRDELIESPRDETLDFFASELVDHVIEYRAAIEAQSEIS